MTILPQDTRRPSHMTVAIRSGDLRIVPICGTPLANVFGGRFADTPGESGRVRVWLDDERTAGLTGRVVSRCS